MTSGPPHRFNLAEHCLTSAAAPREKTALLVVTDTETGEPSETWTYGALEDAVLRVAGGLLATGLKRGDRVLIRLENRSSYPVVFLGAIAAGFLPIPTSSQLTEAEARFLAEDSEAAAIAVVQGLASGAGDAGRIILNETEILDWMRTAPRADYARTLADDAAYLIYTSGTTARPKGVVHAQRVILGRRPMYEGWYGISPDDRILHAGAFNWTYTLGTGLLDPWANGATSIIFSGEKTPGVWPALMRSTGATIFAAVPSLVRQVLKYAPAGRIDVGPLRHGLIAGEKPPEDLFDAWYVRTGTELHEALGMSELSTYVSTAPGIARRSGATGKAQAGRRVVILPEEGGEEPLPVGQSGLIAVHRSDPGLMLGYWKRPEEESQVYRGEWFIGGDIGVMDEDGYFTHLGRANDLMKALGYRVAPQEVEAVVAEFPGVADVACAEVQVREDVSIIGAFVVVQPEHHLDAEAIKRFVAERLAAYKCPREIIFVSQLPRTANGKLKRSALSKQAERSEP